jgi:hypothetical protein
MRRRGLYLIWHDESNTLNRKLWPMFQSIKNPTSKTPAIGGASSWKIIAYVALAAAIVGFVAAKFLRTPSNVPVSTVAEASEPPATREEAATVISKPPAPPVTPKPVVVPTPVVAVAMQPVAVTARDRVAEMWELCGIHGPVTAEQAEKFKAHLEELIRGGASSVAAIREFLEKNVDLDFGQVSGGDQLSYSSLRAAFFDALKQIGGLEAQGALVQVLETSAVPGELLEVAKNLEVGAPGQYREQILRAAREALEMASVNQLGTNAELGPAYRILNTYGEAGTAENAPKHDPNNFYTAIAMANMPDGQGLEGLIQMAQNPSPDASGKIVATEMIAQLAGNNAQALETLVQMVEREQISNRVWTRLAPILGGDQYQITPGDGNSGAPYTVVNGATTADQINQRMGLIDRFLGVVAPDSAAAAALRHERQLLALRLTN